MKLSLATPAWVRRAVSFAAGFVREHAPESSVRLCMILFAAAGCIEAHRIVSFAFVNPEQHLTVAELVGVVTVLLGTGCIGMALRTRSGDSAQAQLEQLASAATKKLTGAAEP